MYWLKHQNSNITEKRNWKSSIDEIPHLRRWGNEFWIQSCFMWDAWQNGVGSAQFEMTLRSNSLETNFCYNSDLWRFCVLRLCSGEFARIVDEYLLIVPLLDSLATRWTKNGSNPCTVLTPPDFIICFYWNWVISFWTQQDPNKTTLSLFGSSDLFRVPYQNRVIFPSLYIRDPNQTPNFPFRRPSQNRVINVFSHKGS